MEFTETLDKTLYRAREAASILSVSTKSIYHLLSKGILEGVKFRRSIRILGGSLLKLKHQKQT